MEHQITDEEWSDFIKVTTRVLEENHDPHCIDTFAEALSEPIYRQYRVISYFLFMIILDNYISN